MVYDVHALQRTHIQFQRSSSVFFLFHPPTLGRCFRSNFIIFLSDCLILFTLCISCYGWIYPTLFWQFQRGTKICWTIVKMKQINKRCGETHEFRYQKYRAREWTGKKVKHEKTWTAQNQSQWNIVPQWALKHKSVASMHVQFLIEFKGTEKHWKLTTSKNGLEYLAMEYKSWNKDIERTCNWN